MRNLMRAAALSVALTLSCSSGHAEEPNWPTAPYDYVAVDEDLRNVLSQFGTNIGVRMVLSDAVQGRVRGGFPPAPPREFLVNMSRAFGLDWYFDGAVISVSAASEAQTRILPLKGVPLNALQNGLAAAGLLDPRFQLRAGLAPDVAVVSGPPRYLAVVEQAASAMASGKPANEPLKTAAKEPVTAGASEPPKEAKASPPSLVIFRGSQTSRIEFP